MALIRVSIYAQQPDLSRAGNDKVAEIMRTFPGRGVMAENYAKELTEMELLRCIEFSRLSLDWESQSELLKRYCDSEGCDFDQLYEKVVQSRYEVDENE